MKISKLLFTIIVATLLAACAGNEAQETQSKLFSKANLTLGKDCLKYKFTNSKNTFLPYNPIHSNSKNHILEHSFGKK